MHYTLAVKDLPFEPDRNQIIYIDGSNNIVVENLIKFNHFSIRRCFEARGYDFCYIPYLKKELEDYEKIHYNAPYAKSGHAKYITDDNFILKFMLEPKKRGEIPPSLLYYIPDYEDKNYPDAQYLFRAVTINEQSFKDDSVFASEEPKKRMHFAPFAFSHISNTSFNCSIRSLKRGYPIDL